MESTRVSRERVTGAVVALGFLVSLVGAAAPGMADHLDPVTARCTYEIPEPQTQFTPQFATDDPTGATDDGAINKGVCAFHTPASDPGEGSDLGPAHVLLNGVTTIEGQYSVAQASVVDDVYGNAVGGALCADFNHDHLCGDPEEGEPLTTFCGTSPPITVGQDSDDNDHDDFGWGLVVGVNGPVWQALNCDPVAAPASTTGGVMDPAGGIFVTVSG